MFRRILFIVLILLFVLSVMPVYAAQDLPPTAQEGLQVVQQFILAASALIATYLVTRIRNLPFLADDEKSKIAGVTADAVAAITAVVVAVVMAYGAILAGFLDDNGFWEVIRWAWYAWPGAFAIHKVKKLSRIGAG